jgi:hypothetical protein
MAPPPALSAEEAAARARARAAAVDAVAATVSACVIGGVAGRRHQPRNKLFAQRVRVGE